MNFQIITLFFLFLAIVLAFFVLTAKNPIYAILNLILIFICVSVVLMLNGSEFLAFIYIIVYVGAVMILFLWIVMTIPLKREFVYQSLLNPILILLFTSILMSLIFVFFNKFTPRNVNYQELLFFFNNISNSPFSLESYKNYIGTNFPFLNNLVDNHAPLLLFSLFPYNGNMFDVNQLFCKIIHFYLTSQTLETMTITKLLLALSVFPGMPQHISFRALHNISVEKFDLRGIFLAKLSGLYDSKCFILSLLPFNANKCNFMSFIGMLKSCSVHLNKPFPSSYLFNYSLVPFNPLKCQANQHFNLLSLQMLINFNPYKSMFEPFYEIKRVFSPLFLLGVWPTSLKAVKHIALVQEFCNLEFPDGLVVTSSYKYPMLFLISLESGIPFQYLVNFFTLNPIFALTEHRHAELPILTFRTTLFLLSIMPSNPVDYQFLTHSSRLIQFFKNLCFLDRNNMSVLMFLSLFPNNLTMTDLKWPTLLYWINKINLIDSYNGFFSVTWLLNFGHPPTQDAHNLNNFIENISNFSIWSKFLGQAFSNMFVDAEHFKHTIIPQFILSNYWVDAIFSNDSWFPKNFGEVIYLFLIEIVILVTYLLFVVIVGIIGLAKFLSHSNEDNKSNNKTK